MGLSCAEQEYTCESDIRNRDSAHHDGLNNMSGQVRQVPCACLLSHLTGVEDSVGV